MSDRLKIMACGYVSRDDKTNNVLCESIYIDQDTYKIKVCGASTDDIIDVQEK